MGQKYLLASGEILIDLCKADGRRILQVTKNRLPEDTRLVGIVGSDYADPYGAHFRLLVESAEWPETEDLEDWPAVEFQVVSA